MRVSHHLAGMMKTLYPRLRLAAKQLALFSRAIYGASMSVWQTTMEQRPIVADAVAQRLLTLAGFWQAEYSDERWDKPSGWAPLQWMAIQGI